MPLVTMQAVTRFFPPTTHALADASLRIEQGESVAIVGPSGSGKTTLLSIMGLLDTPTTGSYLLAGVNVGATSADDRTRLRREHLGFIFQAFHLIGHLTATENVAIALAAKGWPSGRAHDLAREYIAQVGLDHVKDAFPSTLSGGEQQRVAIARALAPGPRLLLCDEPTGSLDSASSQRTLSLIHSLAATSAIVLITHDEGVARTCQRTLTVIDGVVSES